VALTAVAEIQQVPVGDLSPYANNPRTHSASQLDRLVQSLKEFGFTNPLLVGDDMQIVAGHGRLMAAQALGLETVPVIKLSHLTEDQKRAYVIADNQLALNSGWDDDLLQAELQALGDVGFDLTVLGWGEELPTFGEDVDLSALEDMEDEDLSEYADGVRKAIQIDFEPEDYIEAQALVSDARKQGKYVGMLLINALKDDTAL
jgi:ParB-like chromosome segregation protein Spo0J